MCWKEYAYYKDTWYVIVTLAAAAWMALEPPACLTSTKKVSKNAREEEAEDASLVVRTL